MPTTVYQNQVPIYALYMFYDHHFNCKYLVLMFVNMDIGNTSIHAYRMQNCVQNVEGNCRRLFMFVEQIWDKIELKI